MDFDPSDRDVDRAQRIRFWESSRCWFEEQGYSLYENVDSEGKKYAYARPTKECRKDIPVDEIAAEDPFPYAFMGPGRLPDSVNPWKLPPYGARNLQVQYTFASIELHLF